MFKQYNFRNYHFRLVAYVVALTILGILVIGSANEDYQSKQIIGLILGLIVMTFFSLFDYTTVVRFGWIIYGLNIILLGWVLVAGTNVNGSTRWIEVAGIRVQPSELGKILLILFFAYFFTLHQEHLNTVKYIGLSLLLAGIPLVMIKEQPDLSTTIVTFLIFVSLLFIAGLSYKIIAGVLAVSIPGAIVFLSLILQEGQTILDDYQYKRIMAWLNPSEYADSAYQQQNSITAIGSGQLWGKGLNNTATTSVKNGNFISEPQTDFIFAVVGEELGFVGSAVIVVLLCLIAIECILIARKSKDLAGKLICTGMASLIAFQSFVNISVATGIMPNTGIPLPFVSYGLTSLVTLYLGIGLVLNVGLQPKKY